MLAKREVVIHIINPSTYEAEEADLYGHMASHGYIVWALSQAKQNKKQRPQTKSENMPVQCILYTYLS